MNAYAEAVKKGGDYWNNYMPEKMASSHAQSGLTQANFDDLRMYMAAKYTETRRFFQTYTPGLL